jgi:hypothetical protein
MPSKTPRQRRFIFAKRRQYKRHDKTPKKWKWIWNEEWTKLAESRILNFMDWCKDPNSN